MPNKFVWSFRLGRFYNMPAMIFYSLFEIFTEASIKTFIFLTLQNVNLVHKIIIQRSPPSLKLWRTLLRNFILGVLRTP